MDSGPRKSLHVNAIDGLRGVAVLAIIIFHLQDSWLPGGFVGVDIFYVISGFVVAFSVKSAVSDKFSHYFLWFYRRRVLRIFPVAIVFVLVTTIICVLFIPDGYASNTIPKTATAALFGVSNIVILNTLGSYFGTSTAFNPFTHTWSLAVEEQYYLIFPFFSYYLLIKKDISSNDKRIAEGVLLFLCLASLIFCAVCSYKAKSFAFYMMPTRFWELGIGFLLYYYQSEFSEGSLFRRVQIRIPENLLNIACFAGLLVSLIFCSQTYFPFPWAILPCLATVGLIGSVFKNQSSVTARVLGGRPLVAVGKISYSLYLWHWAVIVVMRWTVGIDSLELKFIAVIIMVVLSLISYNLIEKAARYAPNLATMPFGRFYGAFIVFIAVSAVVCSGLYWKKPKITLVASGNAQVWSPSSKLKIEAGGCTVATAGYPVDGGGYTAFTPRGCAKPAKPILYVLGDSHAGAYRRVYLKLVSNDGYTVRLYTYTGCKPLSYFDADIHALADCPQFIADSLRQIASRAKPGDILFLPGLYTRRFRDFWDSDLLQTRQLDLNPAPEDHQAADRGYHLLEPVIAKGASIVMEAPKPVMKNALFRCADWFNRLNHYCRVDPSSPREELLSRRSRVLAYLVDVSDRSPQIRLWDPFNILCPGRRCEGYMDGKPLYNDTDHLSGYGDDLLYPYLRREFQSVSSGGVGAGEASPRGAAR